MQEKSILKRRWARGTAVIAATAFSLALAAPAGAKPLEGVTSAKVNSERAYVVDVEYAGGIQGKITFLEDGIFRYNVDPSGEFSEYAAPRSEGHAAKIQAQPDASDKYGHPSASVSEANGKFVITSGKTTVELDKATAKMSVKRGDKVVMEEAAPLDLGNSTVQTVSKREGENFFGGGTQNGRFIHTGNAVSIAKDGVWVDGGVTSPSPFYWSSEGYGVLRNTFAEGSYDFGKADEGTVSTSHSEGELDAYYFVADAASGKSTAPIAQDLLQAYFKVTGNPVLLPEYAYYLGHLNAWNRDEWKASGAGNGWNIKGGAPADSAGTPLYETQVNDKHPLATGMTLESLNGHGPTKQTEGLPQGMEYPREYSAQARLDNYQANDMPLGYFLPNDGYGAGYGQNGYGKTGGVEGGKSSPERLAAVDANVENLKEFSDYAAGKGVATGLWTQSYLVPDDNPNTPWHLLRDFDAEVKKGGVTTLKTDVAWVGPGYSMALDGVKTAYDTVTEGVGFRPNIITLNGWAGTQRFGGIWTGDQAGGNWEYIRFHVPTYIGQSLSGNPNIGSDMDGIFGGQPIVATRDYQWKSFTPLMLDMDGWGSLVKSPQTSGDPYTGISRLYLKLKSQLMPYIYTTAASAANIDTGNGDEGMPFVRAIMLSDDSPYAASTATQYEFTMGEDFLVAPVYQNSDGTDVNNGIGDGDDVRNGIYLPGTAEDIWIDYFTGEQYRGGQVLNNFEAPLWKLPLFVKANAIVPMYEPNDNPGDVDRSKRIVEFFAVDGENSYTLFEDSGTTVENRTDGSDVAYGKEDNVSYGGSVKTKIRSRANAAEKKATFTIDASEGGYDGYQAERTTTFTVNVSAKPGKVVAKNGDTALETSEAKTLEEFKKAVPEAGRAVVFYEEAPNLNYNATADSEAVRQEGFSSKKVTTTPKLHVKFAKTNVSSVKQILELEGFVNDGRLGADALNEGLTAPLNFQAPEDALTPTSIKLTWDVVEGATSYDIKVDGMVNSVPAGETGEFVLADLPYHSSHTFQIRTRTNDGYSAWSEPELAVQTLEDPWRNVPVPTNIDWAGTIYGSHNPELAFDHVLQMTDGGFHSGENAVGKAMTIDYGLVYDFDRFDYHPRSDHGNGTVTKMRVETSVDGNHWKAQEVDWKLDAEVKSVRLDTKARYVRLTPLASSGNYFAASELAIYKKDGSQGVELGSIQGGPAVDDVDYGHLTGNILGVENRGDGKAKWTQVSTNGADFNMNDAYDVYDMSFTMSRLDGGTAKTGKVAGSPMVVAGAANAKAGDVVTVDLYVTDAANVNALGALVRYDATAFEFVKGSVQRDPKTASMENLSSDNTFGEDTGSVNIALANRGDKRLLDGTGSVASFQLKAKRDAKVELTSTAWLVGPTCDFVEVEGGGAGELPEAPAETLAEYGMDAFDITMTNDVLSQDDGGNAAKMLQNGSGYAPLFDGDENAGAFEFKWDTPGNHIEDGFLPDCVKVPTDITFKFKEPSVLARVDVLNRADGYNGTVTSLNASIVFEGGEKQDFKFDSRQDVYTLAVDEAHKGDKVEKVVVSPQTTVGTANANKDEPDQTNRMLTLREVNFNYVAPGVSAERVELDEGNATELHVGDVAQVRARVLPQDDRYPYVTVTSSDPSVVAAIEQVSGASQTWFLRGGKAGKATITVAAKANPDVKAEYEVAVKEGVNTKALDEALEAARSRRKGAYTEDSYKKLAEAVAAAEELLKTEGYTKSQVSEAAIKINDAIDALVMRPVKEDELINEGEGSPVEILGESAHSDANVPGNVLDGNKDTHWETPYHDGAKLPQYIAFDLGSEYVLDDVTFLPRQLNMDNGDIFKAEVFVAGDAAGGPAAADADGRGEPAWTSVGVYSFKNNGKTLENRNQFQQVALGGVSARYVKFVALESGGGSGNKPNHFCSASEFRFYGKRGGDQQQMANVGALKALVEKYRAEGLKAEAYTEDTWKPFVLALKDAEDMLSNPPAADKQAVVDELAGRLEQARENLVKKPVEPESPAKADLDKLIEKADGAKTEGKSDAVVAEFQAALENARRVAADPDASEGQLKDAFTRLNEALAKLEADTGGGQGGQTGGSGDGQTGQGGSGGSTGGGQGGSGTTDKPGASKPGSGDKLVQTGDPVGVAVAAAGSIGGLIAAIGAKLRHRRRS